MDAYGLCDPLLSRLPVRDEKKWRIGHFKREIPHGYARALADERNLDLMDAGLADYYRKVRIITRDPVFSVERATTIFHFSMGKYDHWVEAYIKKQSL
jgi:arabinofuranosyltransferase